MSDQLPQQLLDLRKRISAEQQEANAMARKLGVAEPYAHIETFQEPVHLIWDMTKALDGNAISHKGWCQERGIRLINEQPAGDQGERMHLQVDKMPVGPLPHFVTASTLPYPKEI